MSPARTAVTLVLGGRAGAREAAIAAAMLPDMSGAVILEGLADADDALAGLSAPVLRIAPGCLCCSGNLVLRVTLNRLLRQRPAQLFISLADAAHVQQLRLWLASAPYDTLLSLTPDLRV
ncbi:G3E family GTPase [Oxalobacteraceae bacterium GrIS 1.11]